MLDRVAASTDYTIHRISSKEPLAIVVNPKSKIPWENIINRYKLQGEPEPQETLSGYADAFVEFLEGVPYDKKWAGAAENDSRLLFLGYGCNDVYPSSLALKFTFGDEDIEAIEQVEEDTVTIGTRQETAIRMMGDFDRLAPVLHGPSREFVDSYKSIQNAALAQYMNGVLESVKGSEEVSAVEERFDAFKKENILNPIYEREEDLKAKEINAGLRSFSMTDLVLSAETLLNANVRLTCLMSGHRPPSECVREIAVITRPEGIRWIKHSYIFE